MIKVEILSLRWDQNVDLLHRFILLDKTKNVERREIPINDTLRVTLQGIVKRLDVPYVFYNRATGKHIQWLTRSFSRALKRTGIKDFRFHDLRHIFGSWATQAGVDLYALKKLGRW